MYFVMSETIGTGPTAATVTVANGSAPTMAEMVALGILPPNFSPKALNGDGLYHVALTKSPTGCVTPDCNIEGLVWIDSPFRTNAFVDPKRVGLAMREIGPDSAATALETPLVLSGFGGKWATGNPVAPAVGGILGVRAGYSSEAWAAYLRLDGSRWMKGNLNVGAHSVVNANQFVSVQKNTGDVCTDSGALGSGTIGGKGVAMVCQNGTWQPTKEMGNPGDACAPEGKTAASIADNEGLVCKLGKYVRLVSLIPKAIQRSSVIVSDGTSVIKPVCDVGGVPTFSFNVTEVSVDVTVAPPKQGMYVSATDTGAGWLVKLVLRDNIGNEVSGNGYGANGGNLSAIMNKECTY